MTDAPALVSFDADIKPLFRASDRDAMLRAFDLWSRDDVAAHVAQIATRLKDGSMPCDGAWSTAQVTLLDAWIDGGLRP
jgi:hypothetical protein